MISTDTSFLYEAPDDVSLYVYESVELELSLTTTSLKTDEFIEDTFTCPIKIIKGNQWYMDISCLYIVIFTPLLMNSKNNFCTFLTIFAQLKRDFKRNVHITSTVKHVYCEVPETNNFDSL